MIKINKKSLVTSLLIAVICLFSIIFLYKKLVISNLVNTSVCLSPLTGERIKKPHKLKQATYINTNDSPDFNGLSDANIIFEYPNKNNGTLYKAIFHDTIPKNLQTTIDPNGDCIDYIPKFNFVESINLPSDSKKASILFANLSNIMSSFIYEEGLYYHFKNNVKQIDANNNNYVTVSNIIVQLVDKSCLDNLNLNTLAGSGKGYLFHGGKVLDIKWNKKKDNPIQITDDKGDEVSLVKGSTWWIITDKSASIIYK